MRRYRIINTVSGVDLGIYEGETEAEALDLMAREAGYGDHADACKAAPVEQGELDVQEIV